MARILIAGCGYVGTALGEALAADHHEVFGLRRDPSGLPRGIQPLAFDLASGARLPLAGDFDFAVYCVGANARTEDAYRRAYIDGLEVVLEALAERNAAPKRVFFTSSTSVYAQRGGEWIDEDSPTEPIGFSGRVMLEAEVRLAASGFASTVLRLGGIYGPGRTRLLERVARREAGTARGGPAAPHFTNRIHRDDAAGALRFLMFELPADRTPERCYLGVDCEPASQDEVLAFLAVELGVRSHTVGVHSHAVGVHSHAVDAAGSELDRERAGSKRCSNARLLAAGYRFRYPTFRDGYREVAAAYLSGGA